MPRVLYTAFDIVPSPKGASIHILHNLRGLVNSQFDVHLFTPNDGLLPPEDRLEGARITRISQDLSQNFLTRAVHFGKAVLAHLTLHPGYDVVHYRHIWDGPGVGQNRELNDCDLSRRPADSATERALARFTWPEFQKKLLKIYGKLLA